METTGHLKIIIDGITFELLAKTYFDKRDHILVESSNSDGSYKSRHVYYASISEAGIWRFAQKRNDGGYEKGQHYVTHTFIHIDLQKFINENFHLIPNYDAKDRRENIESFKRNDKTPTIIKSIYEKINEKLDNDPNIIDLFMPFNNLLYQNNFMNFKKKYMFIQDSDLSNLDFKRTKFSEIKNDDLKFLSSLSECGEA